MVDTNFLEAAHVLDDDLRGTGDRGTVAIILTTPGPPVIIDAIGQSRKIVQPVNSDATSRITETVRALIFMTLAIPMAR